MSVQRDGMSMYVLLDLAGLTHKQGSAQISAALECDFSGEFRRQTEAFLLTRRL